MSIIESSRLSTNLAGHLNRRITACQVHRQLLGRQAGDWQTQILYLPNMSQRHLLICQLGEYLHRLLRPTRKLFLHIDRLLRVNHTLLNIWQLLDMLHLLQVLLVG